MNRVIGFAVLALCAFIAYQSYLNSQPGPETQQLAIDTACDIGEKGCTVRKGGARAIKTDVTQRQYQFSTTTGPVTVTCSRTYIWLGPWSCKSAKGKI